MSEIENTGVETESAQRTLLGAAHWLWLSLFVIISDQLTKWLILTRVEVADRISVVPLLDITHRHNTGAAFSFLADQSGWQRWFFVGLALIVSLVILVWLRRLPSKGQSVLAVGLAMILGGALGNVIDRINHGFVVDFILVYYQSWQFPAFNVADSSITVGAALLIIDSIFGGEKKEPHP